jgi:hypothetical protein
MVLPAPPAHASPAGSHWLDSLVVAIELSARGVLTLVDRAAPARLREAYLRLRACTPATDVIIDARQLAELPPGTTVILALAPARSGEDLDWLNLNRPILADRRLNVVLWCELGMATLLAQRAPDLFDWISAWVDCPPAPVAHAVAEVRAAIRARACGVAWDGSGLEDALATIRPGRPVRRVWVTSYQSMLDALASRAPGWLVLEGVDTEFRLRRLRWAMAESGRRVIVFRRVGHGFEKRAPGWWAVDAAQVPIAEAVRDLTAEGGTGRVAALTGLDPDACMHARFALRRGVPAERLEALLAAAADPRAALRDLARQSGWTTAKVIREQAPRRTLVDTRRATAGDLTAACKVLEGAYEMARGTGDPTLIATSAAELGYALLDRGEPQRARECLESASRTSEKLGERKDAASLLDTTRISAGPSPRSLLAR